MPVEQRGKSRAEFLRCEIKQSGRTLYEIAKSTKGAVSRSALHRFIHRQGYLSWPAIDALMDQLGLEITRKETADSPAA